MKSISTSEQSEPLSNRTDTIDFRPKYVSSGLRQMSQITNWFGGLFGGTSAAPFIRCSCCKFKNVLIAGFLVCSWPKNRFCGKFL